MSPNAVLDEMLGPDVVSLIRRDDVTELYCNADGYIWYDSHVNGKVKTEYHFEPDDLLAIFRLIAGQDDKVINEEYLDLSTVIQGYGCRFEGVIPPIVVTPQFNMRKKAIKIFPLEDYVEKNRLSQKNYDYLRKAISERKNILVVGGTGTGKSTFLNALLRAISEINPEHRIITIEDLPELQCISADYNAMFTCQMTTSESKIMYDATRLLRSCMRRSPDRIILGEVRDGSAYSMLKAWNTGHEGGICTVHANNAEKGLWRINSLAHESSETAGLGNLEPTIADTINVVVFIDHVNLGNGRKDRIIKSVIEVDGFDFSTRKFLTHEV